MSKEQDEYISQFKKQKQTLEEKGQKLEEKGYTLCIYIAFSKLFDLDEQINKLKDENEQIKEHVLKVKKENSYKNIGIITSQ